MAGKLCLLCCENFCPEIKAVVAAEGWSDVTVAVFPARCGRPPVSWDELRPMVAADCSEVAIVGNACLTGLGTPPAGWPPVRQLPQQECFQLVAGATLVAEAIARGAYVITPGWLDDWRGKLGKMGFDEASAGGFFRDFARELLLLDTGTAADAPRKLAELAKVVGLPGNRLAVGTDYVRELLARQVAEWRLREEQQLADKREREHARELADHMAAMDFLGRLPLLKDEQETVAAIEEMFHMLFAPQVFQYLRFEGGMACGGDALAPELSRQVQALRNDWAWTDSETGFLLRIARAGETLGIIVVDHFAFPAYRNRYLNLALSIAGVAGLAIDNARTYRRSKDAEEALRKSERSLKMAQAMAHLGHWEMDVGSGEIRWSDETYRILGHAPEELTPSYDAFLQAVHRDDRPWVANCIDAAREGGNFDIEFKIVQPDGQVRVLHGMGEVIFRGADMQPQVIGAIHDITRPEGTELLGVIQDITDRKELERKLEQEAHTDALTGCANRRHFLELARHELARAHRHAEDVSLLMLDLDEFKAINDLHGHAVGDRVLQELVQVCQAILRSEDTIGRLGGEEFAILLPETGSGMAREVAERLCSAVAAVEVPLDGGPALRFTTSIGVATLTPEDFSVSAILGRADQALYEAKRTGRNRVVAA
jgi:diguanylate cyclase (GGDEF)-like protein/PAS domain S-box-containing protein